MASNWELFAANALGGYINRKSKNQEMAEADKCRLLLQQQDFENQKKLWESQYDLQAQREIAQMEAKEKFSARAWGLDPDTDPDWRLKKLEKETQAAAWQEAKKYDLMNEMQFNRYMLQRGMPHKLSDKQKLVYPGYGPQYDMNVTSDDPFAPFPKTSAPKPVSAGPTMPGAPIGGGNKGGGNRNKSLTRSWESNPTTTSTTTTTPSTGKKNVLENVTDNRILAKMKNNPATTPQQQNEINMQMRRNKDAAANKKVK